MTMARKFPDWKKLYKDREIEDLPWFYPGLDPDLENALDKFGISSGKALDIGTGPGTQAIALAERGFKVTGTDLSGTAIRKARIKAEEAGVTVDFRQDDMLDSTLGTTFDLVFDRGVFHTMQPDMRAEYLGYVYDLVNPGGYLFVKCFSHLETMEEGPHRFSPDEIRDYFSGKFEILSIDDTVYHGTLDPYPRALFTSMRKPGA
ncbi:MAG: class I SAM-dependent methyltransferase [Nitrospirota bacterium]|nr:MAG: class I SAM-dependent methyltransferase [Nitrospirota bacterium]